MLFPLIKPQKAKELQMICLRETFASTEANNGQSESDSVVDWDNYAV